MSFFLFNPRVVSFPTLANIRSRLNPNHGHPRTFMTRVLAKQNYRPYLSTLIQMKTVLFIRLRKNFSVSQNTSDIEMGAYLFWCRVLVFCRRTCIRFSEGTSAVRFSQKYNGRDNGRDNGKARLLSIQ